MNILLDSRRIYFHILSKHTQAQMYVSVVQEGREAGREVSFSKIQREIRCPVPFHYIIYMYKLCRAKTYLCT